MMTPEEYEAAQRASQEGDVDMEENQDTFKDITKDLKRKTDPDGQKETK